jgi:hypothetical protein
VVRGPSKAPKAPGKLVLLPALPPPPRPPKTHTDSRQSQRGDDDPPPPLGGVSGPAGAPARGFIASAVDLGRLKAALELGIVSFTITQLQSRWGVDVRAWMMSVLRTWVQRPKFIRLELRDRGVRVQLQTQDDFGYYEYSFDVFPGR